MRKGVGLGALMGSTQHQSSFQSHGTSIRNTHIEQLTTQFEVFRASLAHFAQSHAKDIRSNPSFRAEFARMCQVIGVDPLASSSGKKGSFWAEMLGGSVGDFYFELAVRVVEVCRVTREENGGLIEVKEVKRKIEEAQEKVGGGIEIAEDDVVRSVEALKPLGGGFSIVEIGKRRFIRSVPRELSSDQFVVIEAAQIMGFVTVSMLQVNLGWDRARVQTVLDDLISESLVWVDDQAEEREYWIPRFET